MDIRNATEEDLTTIVDIYNSTISDRLATADTEPVTVESRLSWLQNRDFRYRPIWVMEIDRVIVGWLSFNNFYGRPAYSHTAEISIYVAANYRHRGCSESIIG